MSRKQIYCGLMVFVGILVAIAGCQESRWGVGETPDHWQKNFGDGNIARLNFKQMQMLEKHEVLLKGIDVPDPNDSTKKIHQNGLVDYIVHLLARVKALEEKEVESFERRE